MIFCLHIFHTTIHTKREGRFSAPPPSLSDENRPRTLNRVKQVPREAEPCRLQILRHIGNDTLVDELPSLIDDDGIFRLKVRVKNGLQCYSFLNVRSLFPAPITLADMAVGVARFFPYPYSLHNYPRSCSCSDCPRRVSVCCNIPCD